MSIRTERRSLASLAPYSLLHTPDEQVLLQYYRQLSQADRCFIRRSAQALSRYSATEQGEKA
ncbi:hypothetical protein PSH28_18535 [Pseudomonas resinovorans]|uniref:hypothetical protein n=1 Tax=Metapseudomonas resinovorans TaxID=53412 RepID=UPI00237F1EB1|nr:hypothetical protein [Pseudomonas resinovorans]MDE3738606.1 hypothetical protein [Pseudomonas resinovorans]